VKKLKLKIIPKVIPKGLAFDELADEDKTIGRIGQIHGARIVASPAKKANPKRTVTLS